MSISNFLKEINQSNSSNYKLEILQKYKDSKEVELFLKLAYDKISFIYGIKKIPEYDENKGVNSLNIKEIKEHLIKFHNRELTGNTAINYLKNLLEYVSKDNQYQIKCILERDIHSGISTTQINKIFKNLIKEFPYMRCSLQDKIKNIKYPAFLQIKADGTFRNFVKKGNHIAAYSRDGKEYFHPRIFEALSQDIYKDGVYIGELICENIEGKNSTEIRYKSNGLLNSLNPPYEVEFFIWDYLTYDEFNGEKSAQYSQRFEKLKNMIKLDEAKFMKSIKTELVFSIEDAFKITKEWISNGEEGAILKNTTSLFKNGTSTEQIKLKPEIEVEVRCIGFTQGNGKFKDTFGAIEFKTDDDKVFGQVSGINDNLRNEISKNRSKYLNKIFSLKATEITKAKNSETYGLMHPRFIEFREDKDYTDSLERIQNMGLK